MKVILYDMDMNRRVADLLDILKDIALVFFRIFTIFPLLLFVTLFMGRRSIGEMPVFDFLIILALGAVVGADIADPKIEHIHTAFAILLIGLIQKLFSTLVIRYRKFGRAVTFEPVIVIHQGKLIHDNLKKLKYSIDNILHMLRKNNIFNTEDIYLAVIEGNGNLSVLEKSNHKPPSISYPVIKEGRIEDSILRELELEESWIHDQLIQNNTRLKDIFLAMINEQHVLHITLYDQRENQPLPPIYH